MNATFRALVVEDDAIAREATVLALQDEGFVCNSACDGTEAIVALDRSAFDVVVTDLRMPKRHGHSLAVEVIGRGSERPLVVVLTGILEPRLLKDLFAHEVDDIVFKPVDLSLFSAKVRALCERRSRHRHVARNSQTVVPEPKAPPVEPDTSDHLGQLSRVSQQEVDHRLRDVLRIPTVSEAAIDVFNLINNADTSSQQVAAAVQREPALIADVLRLANSSFFTSSTQKCTSVEQAVVRLGQKRVGELALTTATFATVTQAKIPFFPFGRIWKKCLAAGICLEMLLEHSNSVSASTGMFCAAVLQPMGRILLASAFPELYERMLKLCAAQRKPLSEFERFLFPQSPGEVAATALASWGIPDSIHRPLRHVKLMFHELSSIGEPLRHRVELIKTAGFLGDLVTSQFDGWDNIDIPPTPMLNRLGIRSIETTVRQCREDLKQITSLAMNGMPIESKEPEVQSIAHKRPVVYKRLNSDSVDFVQHLLSTSGRSIVGVTEEVPDDEDVVVNALGAAAHQVVKCLRKPRLHEPVIISDADNAGRLEGFGHVVVIPCAYSRLSELLGVSPLILSEPDLVVGSQSALAAPR